jgi:hypothetical protein
MSPFTLSLSLFLTFSITMQAEPIHFQSAAEQTPLLELYTSEGCSSCPPAESWLSHLKDSPGLWRDFVPVAFHVDYWDYLGWRDPWSAREYSDRQRAYAASWQNDSIYTPGLVLNGREWRDWARGQAELKISGTKAGVLNVTSADTNHWQVTFAPVANAGNYEVHATLLVSGVSSAVKGGENRGRKLNHDFAVLKLVSVPLTRSGEMSRGEFVLPVPINTPGGSLAMAVWVTQAGRLEPLQATGGWIAQSIVAH